MKNKLFASFVAASREHASFSNARVGSALPSRHLAALSVLAFLSTFNLQPSTANAQSTAFTYQGQLNDNGSPANGNYDLQFYLRDAATGGNPAGMTNTLAPVAVSNGLFSVTLDFGAGVFDGSARWLEIGVRTNGSVAAYSTLSPRQPVTPSPYAILAGNVSGTVPSSNLSGTYSNAVSFNNAANQYNGAFTGNGTSVSNVNAVTLGGLGASNFWQLGGNPGTTPAINFVGTLDNQPLELRVNNQAVMSLNPGGNVGIGTNNPQAALHVNGNAIVNGTNTVKVLSITGGADVAEPFPMSITDIPKGAVVVIDDEHPGRVKLSERAYDQRVAGIVSGANGVQPGLTLSQQGLLDAGQNVALSGRVYALADAGNGSIKAGDLLTTSKVPGHAMKVTDHAKAQGAILGKAMSSLKAGRGYVLVLVTLQ